MSEAKTKKKFRMPHAYVIILAMTVITAILANIVPAGEFERTVNEAGREVVVAGSFRYIDSVGCSVFDMFKAIQVGCTESAQIIFFIIFAYAFVSMLLKNGAFDSLVGAILRKTGDRIEIIIPLCMVLFGILGSTVGLFEETYGLLPVFISIAMMLGYDAIVGGSIIYIGVAVGFAAATINPFTIGVAQQVAGLRITSGIGYRIFCFVIFMSAAIIYVWRYARRIKSDPTKSVLYGYKMETVPVAAKEELIKREFTVRQKLSCIIFLLTIVILLYGTLNFGWYIDEIATLFIIMMVVEGVISGFTASQICEYFIEAAQGMMYGALLVGLSRSIQVIMEDAMIIDTVVFYISNVLQNFTGAFSAVGMLFAQNIINFFIPSGSGQALVTIPILAPVGDIIGISRQVTVLAFQFGDGFSNIFWPTSVFMMCGIMRMPIDRWYRFITPLFGILFILQIILLILAMMIGYV